MKDSCQLGSYTGCEPKDCQTVQFISYKLLDLIPRENYKLLAIECYIINYQLEYLIGIVVQGYRTGINIYDIA